MGSNVVVGWSVIKYPWTDGPWCCIKGRIDLTPTYFLKNHVTIHNPCGCLLDFIDPIHYPTQQSLTILSTRTWFPIESGVVTHDLFTSMAPYGQMASTACGHNLSLSREHSMDLTLDSIKSRAITLHWDEGIFSLKLLTHNTVLFSTST